uniref:Uncharacterized LOC100180353 n=1 Tax=Ciona intestinalis TaxID=7719 RepID=F6R699_CIOIN|nr:uncharacterized protein LOC100180353 [Ciona intestinalis]|eukprot:XP_002127569.1 uncharacterized protein LOC100180353 [Ciona intestinalis]
MEWSVPILVTVMLSMIRYCPHGTPVNMRFVKLKRLESAKPPQWWYNQGRGRVKKATAITTAPPDPLFPSTCAARAEFGLPTCCHGQDPNCYTASGCFCDIACYLYFDDCCSDHRSQCYNQLTLCVYGQPKLPKKTRNPNSVRPDSCCGESPFNTSKRTCCGGRVVLGANVNCDEIVTHR